MGTVKFLLMMAFLLFLIFSDMTFLLHALVMIIDLGLFFVLLTVIEHFIKQDEE